MDYYDSLAEGYDELHREEQFQKFEILTKNIQIRPDATVLDIGCGTGLSSEYIPGSITGADPALKALMLAKNRLSQVVQCRAECLPFKSNAFEYVIAITAVHNFYESDSGLREILRTAKSTAVISVLRRSNKFEKITASIKEIFEDWKCEKLEDDEKDVIFVLTRN
jgi:ubiquinone/menaquinone biosynthesis C-methylase UbiE